MAVKIDRGHWAQVAARPHASQYTFGDTVGYCLVSMTARERTSMADKPDMFYQVKTNMTEEETAIVPPLATLIYPLASYNTVPPRMLRTYQRKF